MNQVKEVYRRNKVIEGIMMFFQSLSVNEAVNQDEVDREADMIREEYQDNELIDGLVKNTGTVNISLKDNVVEKATVSEKAARKKADEVRMQKEETQKEIGE